MTAWPVSQAPHSPGSSASPRATDLDDGAVRRHVLAHGRVDVKVAAIDATWSGLKNVLRVADRE
jgi:hypothetical protein